MNDNMLKLLDTAKEIDKLKSPYEYNGRSVPRVTSIISSISTSNGLMYWANSLGFKNQSYSKTIKKAADIGTQCHNSIDLFLDNNYEYEPPYDIYPAARFGYESFLKWWNDIHAGVNKIEVIYHEFSLACKYFGGTLDGLYRINGKIYLIDYKTSNHITYRYCLQLAAYRYMLREELGIEIDGCIILQLSKNDISYNEFVLNLSDPDQLSYMNQCEHAFLSITYAYYNIMNVENGYNALGWG